MILSDFGRIVETEWFKSFEIRNELFLDEFVLMPNHLHAIVIIDKPKINSPITDEIDDAPETDGMNKTDAMGTHETDAMGTHETDAMGTHVETHGRASLLQSSIPPSIPSYTNQSDCYRQPKSISSFVAGFKSAINSKIDDFIDANNLHIPKYNRKNHFFQPKYYDRIIRNHDEYIRIKNYIINNPKKWSDDKFNDNYNPDN